jgi:hypothetical protein
MDLIMKATPVVSLTSGSKTIPFSYFLSKNDLINFKYYFSDIYTKDKTIGEVMKELNKKYLHRNYATSLSKEQCKLLSHITLDLYSRVLPEESMIYVIPKSKSTTKSKSKPPPTKRQFPR